MDYFIKDPNFLVFLATALFLMVVCWGTAYSISRELTRFRANLSAGDYLMVKTRFGYIRAKLLKKDNEMNLFICRSIDDGSTHIAQMTNIFKP
jgi:hypothetical protein